MKCLWQGWWLSMIMTPKPLTCSQHWNFFQTLKIHARSSPIWIHGPVKTYQCRHFIPWMAMLSWNYITGEICQNGSKIILSSRLAFALSWKSVRILVEQLQLPVINHLGFLRVCFFLAFFLHSLFWQVKNDWKMCLLVKTHCQKKHMVKQQQMRFFLHLETWQNLKNDNKINFFFLHRNE